ncbi:hypothetical protein [Enterococcus faecalis]|uniref:hypothetical protein n=1 Tax=Enterococcus faecalis TaxID=1351 RepID=UPI0021628E46|nr:hypothetical protein [Enterococcus faecalis]
MILAIKNKQSLKEKKKQLFMRQSKAIRVFPRDSDKVVPSVVTVSQLDKAPEIYRTTQKDTGKEKQHWSG